MYFTDLSSYNYRLPFTLPRVTCVGWIDFHNLYPKGDLPSEAVERLLEIVVTRNSRFDAHVNVVRGIHPCNICGEDISVVTPDGRSGILGMSEIWIPWEMGYFAAPSLVLHYIAAHRYLPPHCFVEAILSLSIYEQYLGQIVYDKLVANAMTQQSNIPAS